MTNLSNHSDPNSQSSLTSENAAELLQKLRRKEGNWVEWGQACAVLQKAGYNPQQLFEETGFEPIQQNQVIVAAQVYASMVEGGVSEATRSHFSRIGSDSLYELRILTQAERASAAEFILSRNIDSEGSRDVAKAIKEFSRRGSLPEGFSEHPGDAVAYQYWRLAKQQSDLRERSRLISRGLMFAHSQSARQQVEQLLTDLSGTSKRAAPTLPFYRLEADEEIPRLIPFVQLPITSTEFKAISPIKTTGSFQSVQLSGGNFVTLPGWQVVLNASDPVALLGDTKDLPVTVPGKQESILLLIDRSQTEWNDSSYFLVESDMKLQWFPDATDTPLLGKLILILRQKRVLDEENQKDIWQIDE